MGTPLSTLIKKQTQFSTARKLAIVEAPGCSESLKTQRMCLYSSARALRAAPLSWTVRSLDFAKVLPSTE